MTLFTLTRWRQSKIDNDANLVVIFLENARDLKSTSNMSTISTYYYSFRLHNKIFLNLIKWCCKLHSNIVLFLSLECARLFNIWNDFSYRLHQVPYGYLNQNDKKNGSEDLDSLNKRHLQKGWGELMNIYHSNRISLYVCCVQRQINLLVH